MSSAATYGKALFTPVRIADKIRESTPTVLSSLTTPFAARRFFLLWIIFFTSLVFWRGRFPRLFLNLLSEEASASVSSDVRACGRGLKLLESGNSKGGRIGYVHFCFGRDFRLHCH